MKCPICGGENRNIHALNAAVCSRRGIDPMRREHSWHPIPDSEMTAEERAINDGFVKALDEWMAGARGAVSRCADPTERLVLAVVACTRVTKDGVPRWQVHWETIEDLVPETRAASERDALVRQSYIRPQYGGSMDKSCWDHDAVRDWFMSSVKTPPTACIHGKRRGFFGTKDTVEDGWRLKSGSTIRGRDDWSQDLHIATNGRLVRDRGDDASPIEGFNPYAVWQMAEMTGVPLPSAVLPVHWGWDPYDAHPRHWDWRKPIRVSARGVTQAEPKPPPPKPKGPTWDPQPL